MGEYSIINMNFQSVSTTNTLRFHTNSNDSKKDYDYHEKQYIHTFWEQYSIYINTLFPPQILRK